MRVLLVEDDSMIGEAVSQALRDAAYAVDWIQDGLLAASALIHHSFELVLLDLGLPLRDGLSLLREMRARGDDTPAVIITARDEVQDRISGLNNGADDYLIKPFAVGELLARMRAVSRRRGGSRSPLMSNGSITLDPISKLVTVRGRRQALSGREFALLRELLVRPGAVLSRAELEERIYGWGEEVESNVIEYIIHSLRKKIGASSVRNIRGMGWMVDCEV
jgi:two-component system OmpR family response regulator